MCKEEKLVRFATAILVVFERDAVERYQSVPPRHEIIFF